MSIGIGYQQIQSEVDFLRENPQFHVRPASLPEFLGADYLNVDKFVRPRIRTELVNIVGDQVRGDRMTNFPFAIITGAIGIGKTTIASIILPYLCHWCLCLEDPQDYFNLMPGTRIAFMQMSTSEKQAKEVIFGDLVARIDHSPWFQRNYPKDPKYTNQIRFERDIWIIPGDSAETTFEGYNILGGILDEADSHKVTDRMDYAEQGFRTISARVSSRFESKGFVIIIGQMKSQSGFAAKKYHEFSGREDAYAAKLAIWESFGWDHYEKDDQGNTKVFYYDTKRHEIVPEQVASYVTDSKNLLPVPKVFERDFLNNPDEALKDLAGIPPAVGDPFISLTYKIEEARNRWIESHAGYETPVDDKGVIDITWFRAMDTLKRAGHIDIAYSGQGDALGFAMGHVPRMLEIDGELKPYIVIDLLLRLQAPSGTQIFLGDVRRIIYSLRRDPYNFRMTKVTMDGFQSQDMMQQLNRNRIEAEYLSVDREVLPYHDLREALYEDRIEFPRYMVRYRRGDSQLTEIMYKELSELIHGEGKIDHPLDGSKDVADSVAGVTFTLMGDRRFKKSSTSMMTQSGGLPGSTGPSQGFQHPAMVGNGMSAPIPPTNVLTQGNRGY